MMYELPIFPLNTVLFPGALLNLVIFEDRYKAMLKRVMQTNQTFGVNLIRAGSEALGPLPSPYPVGCTARVASIDSHKDGRFGLTVIGDERYRIVQTGVTNGYLTGFVEPLSMETALPDDIQQDSQVLRQRLVRYLGLLNRDLQQNQNPEMNGYLSGLELPDDPFLLIYFAAGILQVSNNEKQTLLEVETTRELLSQVQRLYRRELAMLPELLGVSEEQAQSSAWSN